METIGNRNGRRWKWECSMFRHPLTVLGEAGNGKGRGRKGCAFSWVSEVLGRKFEVLKEMINP